MKAATRFCHLAPLTLVLFGTTAGCDAKSAEKGAPMTASAEAPVEVDPSAAPTAVSPTPAARMVIRRATLDLRAETPADVIAAATELAEGAGGYVEGSSTDAVGDDVQSIRATLRVPADRFDAVLQELRDQGDLLHESLSGEDVTDQHTDLGARLRAKRALEERLLTILSRAEDIEGTLQIEAKLTEVRTDIERLDASVQNLERQVAMATINLSVQSAVQRNRASGESTASRLDRAIDDAGNASIFVLGGVIRFVGVMLPIFFIGAPIAFTTHHLYRRRRRKQQLG